MAEPTLEELWDIGQKILGSKFFDEKEEPKKPDKYILSGNGAPHFLEKCSIGEDE